MAQQRPIGATLFWHGLLFLLAAAVTWAAFWVFVPGPDRGKTFHVAISIVIAAELVFAAHLTHSALARAGVPTASAAARFQVHGLILLWLVLAIVVAVVVVDPERADTLAADKVLVIYLIITFLFFAATYFVYSRSIEVEQADRQLDRARGRVQIRVADVEQAMQAVSALGRGHAAHAVLADRTHKKLEAVRNELEAALVSERADDRQDDWDDRLAAQLAALAGESAPAAAAQADRVPDVLQRIASQADAILSTVRQRERSLMS